MSVKITTEVKRNALSQEYSAEWKIKNISRMKTRGLQTPPFSPIPGIDVSFCFELWFQSFLTRENSFKLTFTKLYGFDVPPNLELKLGVQISYSDGTFNRNFNSPEFICVDSMTSITCMDVSSDIGQRLKRISPDSPPVPQYLLVRCHMKFSGHLTSPFVYFCESRSLNSLRLFTRDFSSIYDSSALSDIIIRIDEKTLHAHKSVLAAHSPVFLKMVEGNYFLESKTNTVTIGDTDYKTFDSFLRYLYSGDVCDKSWLNVTELYKLADKYLVQSLKSECARIIIYCYLKTGNVCEILKIAYCYNDKDLKVAAKLFAANHFQTLIRSVEWDKLVASHPFIGYEVTIMVHKIPENINKKIIALNGNTTLTRATDTLIEILILVGFNLSMSLINIF